jgi:hypothetical protein
MFPDCDGPSAVISSDWVQRHRRTLFLIAVLLAGALIFWQVLRAEKARKQHEAVARIQELGGTVGWDGDDSFYGVNFSNCPVGDKELALVGVFDDFDHVSAGGTRITDAGLRHLRGLRGLHLLYLPDTHVGDDGLAHLAGLRELKALSLSGTRVTDAGLLHLQGMQRLEWLSLSRTRVTDAGVVHLKRLPRLRAVHVYGTGITESGIAELRSAIPELRVNPTGDEADRDENEGHRPGG